MSGLDFAAVSEQPSGWAALRWCFHHSGCWKVQTVWFRAPRLHANMSESLLRSVSADPQNALKVVRASKPRTRKSSKVMYCGYYYYYYCCHRNAQGQHTKQHFCTSREHQVRTLGSFSSVYGHCHPRTSPSVRFFELECCLSQLKLVQDGKLTPAAPQVWLGSHLATLFAFPLVCYLRKWVLKGDKCWNITNTYP